MTSIGSAGSPLQGSSNQYSALIATVTELRTDLERTVSRMHLLEDQNVGLAKNYETVKTELIETRKKYNDMKESYATTLNEKIEGEQKYEAFIRTIKTRLAEKTRDFEKQKEMLKPKDIDSIRIKVQEELEIPHRMKLQAMQAEVEKYKDQYFLIQRDFEKVKTEMDLQSKTLNNSIESLQAKNETTVASLREQIAVLQSKNFAAENDEKLRSCSIRIHELEYSLEIQKNNLSQSLKERDHLSQELEKQRMILEKQQIDGRTKMASLEADKSALDERCQLLLKERETKENINRQLQNTLDELNVKFEQQMRENVDLKNRLQISTDDSIRIIHQLHESYKKEISGLKAQVDLQNAKIQAREESLRRMQKEVNDLQMRSEAEQLEVKRIQQRKAQDFSQKLMNLELELSKVQGNLQVSETTNRQLADQLAAESEVLTSEIQRLKREKEILSEKTKEYEHRREVDQRKMSLSTDEWKSKQHSMEEELKSCQKRIQVLELHLTKAKTQEKDNQITWEKEKKGLEESLHQQQALFEALKKETRSQLEQLHHQYQQKVEDIQAKMTQSVQQERKRGDVYKEKAVSAQNKIKTIMEGVKTTSLRP